MQINPHFFFNTLNTIVSLVQRDPQAAAQTIGKLSSLFRYALDAAEEPLMPFPKEIEYIRTYLEIEKLRFGEKLSYTIDVPADLYGCAVPPMLLQPLVENAVKYGKDEAGAAYVHVRAWRGKDGLRIAVADYGSSQVEPEELELREGTGLRNVRRRLEALGAGSLRVHRNRPRGLVVELVLRDDGEG